MLLAPETVRQSEPWHLPQTNATTTTSTEIMLARTLRTPILRVILKPSVWPPHWIPPQAGHLDLAFPFASEEATQGWSCQERKLTEVSRSPMKVDLSGVNPVRSCKIQRHGTPLIMAATRKSIPPFPFPAFYSWTWRGKLKPIIIMYKREFPRFRSGLAHLPNSLRCS
jgi:hypothetical protein